MKIDTDNCSSELRESHPYLWPLFGGRTNESPKSNLESPLEISRVVILTKEAPMTFRSSQASSPINVEIPQPGLLVKVPSKPRFLLIKNLSKIKSKIESNLGSPERRSYDSRKQE
jgi:hypothetical protein